MKKTTTHVQDGMVGRRECQVDDYLIAFCILFQVHIIIWILGQCPTILTHFQWLLPILFNMVFDHLWNVQLDGFLCTVPPIAQRLWLFQSLSAFGLRV